MCLFINLNMIYLCVAVVESQESIQSSDFMDRLEAFDSGKEDNVLANLWSWSEWADLAHSLQDHKFAPVSDPTLPPSPPPLSVHYIIFLLFSLVPALMKRRRPVDLMLW